MRPTTPAQTFRALAPHVAWVRLYSHDIGREGYALWIEMGPATKEEELRARLCRFWTGDGREA